MKDKKNIPVPSVSPGLATDNIYGLEEAAGVLHLNEQTMMRKLRAKEVVGHKKHGRWFILHSDIINYIKS